MEGFGFSVEVRKTDRKKSASIHLDGNLVRVTVPKSLSDNRIRDLIQKRTLWIKTKLNQQSQRLVPKPKEYVSGETILYLGRNYRLKVLRENKVSIKMKNGYLVATVLQNDTDPQKTIKSLLEDWYQKHAEMRLKEKTKRFSKLIGVVPKSIAVKNYKSRWGSCSSKAELTYNWRIILAPHHIVDYVVVHELCHLLEYNHSSKYWKHVERHIPNYKEKREWLRKCNASLNV